MGIGRATARCWLVRVHADKYVLWHVRGRDTCNLHLTHGSCVCVAEAATLWAQLTHAALWTPRYGAGLVELSQGALLLIGGIDSGYLADVWRSDDEGLTWEAVTLTGAADFTGRFHAATVAMPGDKVLVMGGQADGTFLSDVWQGTIGGSVWNRMATTAEWGLRARHSAVYLPNSDSTVLVAGGQVGSVGLNDVWSSTDFGATWSEVSSAADWAPRIRFGMVAFQDGAVLIAGGYVNGTGVNDVWRSTATGNFADYDNLAAAPWPKREGMAMEVFNDIVVVAGGRSIAGTVENGMFSDVWVSETRGESWHLATAIPGWAARYWSASTVTLTGNLIIAGGRGQSRSDVWRSSVVGGTSWFGRDCRTVAHGICGATPGHVGISVGLASARASALGATRPPSTATAVYAPPVPSLVSPLVSSSNSTLAVDISFTVPVLGLHADDFSVLTGYAAAMGRTLSGSGTMWTLAVTMDAASVDPRVCPQGYTASSNGRWCGRVNAAASTWAASSAACAPFALASARSLAEVEFVAGLIAQPLTPHWYV